MKKYFWSAAVVATLITVGAQAEPNGKGKGGFRPGGGSFKPGVGGGAKPGFPGGVKPGFPGGVKPGFPGGVKPGFPGGVKPGFPIGIKPKPPVKPPVVIGIIKPPVKPPVVIGIIKPPVKPPVVIGIIKPPVKPPVVIGIIKPPVKPPVVIGIIKPPVKPPVIIGIIKPPKKPPVIGIVLPPKYPKPHWPKYPHYPHYPHWPKYPHWPHFPSCPGVGYPIVISQPYPVYVQPQAGQLVLNLQCALPAGTNAQDLSGVNVNLMRLQNGSTEVFGMINDAAMQSMNITTQAMGSVEAQLINLKMNDGDEIFLQAAQSEDGQTYYQGSLRLLGRADKNGLVCQLTQLGQQSNQTESSEFIQE